MQINTLSLTNYRNYQTAQAEFSPYTNVICGDNAQGKTNILEAVYLFSQGRSHRAKSDGELIRFGEPRAKLKLDFSDRHRDFSALMQLERGGKKSIKINQVPITKLSKLMNYFHVVLFSPEDLTLVKGSPSHRRRFMDAAVSQLYPNYLNSLISYHKALSQKNSLLKTLKRQGKKSDDTLSVWNQCLAEEGVRLMTYRRDFLTLLNTFASAIQAEISGEELVVSYDPSIRLEDEDTHSFFRYLEDHQIREIEFASSLYGIQRDDIAVSVGGIEAKVYGSQGQQRTAALSLKIAQADYINHIREEYPVLLLDDIMSELDIHRRNYLWDKIRNKQVLLTCTDTDILQSSDITRLFRVERGTIRPIS